MADLANLQTWPGKIYKQKYKKFVHVGERLVEAWKLESLSWLNDDGDTLYYVRSRRVVARTT